MIKARDVFFMERFIFPENLQLNQYDYDQRSADLQMCVEIELDE